MKTGFENKTNNEILEYLESIKGDTKFNQADWNLFLLEMSRRLCKLQKKRIKIDRFLLCTSSICACVFLSSSAYKFIIYLIKVFT